MICVLKNLLNYDNNIDYIEKNISITRVLSWYCKSHIINDLKQNKGIKDIIKEYNDNFQYNIPDEELEELIDDNHNKEGNSSISSSNNSSNF